MIKRQKQKQKQERKALKHMKSLFELEQKIVYKNNKLANRYIQLIRRLAMKFRLKTPSEMKRAYCKHCYVALAPGQNCRIRTRNGKLVYYCYNCKKYTRIPIKNSKSSSGSSRTQSKSQKTKRSLKRS
jgi:ribonuclease P protein subunit RPR2